MEGKHIYIFESLAHIKWWNEIAEVVQVQETLLELNAAFEI